MNIISWILQIVLAIFFIRPGLNNLFRSPAGLIEEHQLQPGKSPAFNRFLGVMQLLGVIGLILPCLLHIFPILTAIAALGFCIMMIAAAYIHKNDSSKKLFYTCLIMAFVALAVFILNV